MVGRAFVSPFYWAVVVGSHHDKLGELTNSAHDTGVVSECKKGNCTKELEVQFSSSNSLDETKRTLEE